MSINIATSYDIILNTYPYNDIILNCSAMYQPIEQLERVNEITFYIVNGSYSNISTQENVFNSSLSLNLTEPGNYTYYCITNFQLKNQISPTNNYTKSTSIIVKGIVISVFVISLLILGPNYPLKPTNILSSSINSTSVNVSWIIESVTYTPEIYTIYYWASTCDNNTYNTVVKGSTILEEFTKQTNTLYTAILIDLLPATNYNYYISSDNTYGHSNSLNKTFTTQEMSKK